MDSQHTAKVKSIYYNNYSGDKIIISVNIVSNDNISKNILNDFSNFLSNYKINGYLNEDEVFEEKERAKEMKLKEKEDKKKSKKTKVKIDF